MTRPRSSNFYVPRTPLRRFQCVSGCLSARGCGLGDKLAFFRRGVAVPAKEML